MRRNFLFAIVFALLPLAVLAAESFPRDLYWGLQNDPDVKRLQEFLRDKDFYTYPKITGNYFSSTRAAVLKFQTSQNITPANGSFVGETRARANQLFAPSSSGEVIFALFVRDLAPGLRANPDVVRLQEFLRERGFFIYPESTGNYFAITQEAVRAYQAQKRIPATGITDALTRVYINQEILMLLLETPDTSAPVEPSPQTATSTFYKKIDISGFTGRSTNPLSEKITVSNKSKTESISITGWEFETSLGTRFSIPSAYNLPGLPASAPAPIVLPPGGRLIITGGTQDTYTAFRENICTGYFTEQTKFTPSISKQCPQPDTRELLYLGDKCMATLDKIPRCTIPTQTHFFAQTSECSTYMIQHLTYAGCVRDHRRDENFYKNDWHVWLGRQTELFRNIHETLLLRDTAGKFVDEREY